MSKANVPHSYATAKNSYRPAQTSEPGFTLHKLRHDDFHVVCGMREEVRAAEPDAPFCAFSPLRAGDIVISPDGRTGSISGFAVDSETRLPSRFARVDGRLYHIGVLKRA